MEIPSNAKQIWEKVPDASHAVPTISATKHATKAITAQPPEMAPGPSYFSPPASGTNEDILFITYDRVLGKDHYAFTLADDTKLEFFENGKIYKVKSEKGVMDVFIPEAILKYANATFPNSTITAYKNEGWRQKLELNNSIDLIFSKRGKFLSIED